MAFRSHQPSGKTPEDLAAQREHRLRARIANALLEEVGSDGTAVDEAVRTLRETMRTPEVRRATTDHAAGILLAQASNAAGNGASFTVQQGIQIDAASFLRAVQSAMVLPTTGCGPALAGAPDPALPPVGGTSGDLGLQQARVTRGGATVPTDRPAPAATDPVPEPRTAAWRDWSERYRPGPPPAALLRCPDCGAVWEDGPERACPVGDADGTA